MFGEYGTGFGAFVRKWGYLMLSLILLLSLSSRAIADTNPSDLFLQNFGPRLNGAEGDVQSIIDQLSGRLTVEPYRAELYYHLARAYDVQGWHDKAAQYMNQWVRLSNPDTVTQTDHAFVLDEKNDAVLAINRITGQVVRKINVGWAPRKMIPTPDGSQIYVPNALADSVSVINTREMIPAYTIKTGRMPWNGKSSPQGDRVYVTNLKGNDVSVIDVADNTLLETVAVGQGPWGIAVSPDGHRLYISNQNSQAIQVIDTGSYSVVDVIAVGTHPRDIALAPDDENKLYAIDENIVNDEIEIYIVDLGDARITRTLDVPATSDPLLKPFGQMSLADKLALLKGVDATDKDTPKRIPKRRLRGIPALFAVSHPSSLPTRTVFTGDATPGEVELPMGGPAPLAGPRPLMQARVKVPTAVVEEETENNVPQEPAKQAETPKQERRVLRIVVVVRNDSLWKISLDNYGTVDSDILAAIQDINPRIKDLDRIYVGQEIKLPELKTYQAYEGRTVKVRANDNLFRIALRAYGIVNKRVYAEIQKANPRIKDVALIEIGQRIILPDIPDIPFKDSA